MKKVILGIVGVIVVLGLAIGVKIYVFPEPTHLDVLSNLELTFEGMEESGKASIKGNDIQYDGDDKEVLDFIASLKYEISPNKNLSNYDDVEVQLIFDEKARKEANVELESTSRTYQVRGLEETPEQKAERVEIILTKEYANNSSVAFKRANEYGFTSSQEFKVQPIIEKDETIGYECIFKGSE